jgi:hypothetical protein
MPPLKKSFGVPANITTWLNFTEFCIDTLDVYLQEKELSLEDWILGFLNNGLTNTSTSIITNSSTNHISLSDSSEYNTLPTYSDIMASGFSPALVDSLWTDIKDSDELQSWFNGMATTLPYLSVLSEPTFDNKQKKFRIKKIVPFVLSVLYNNYCDFGENNGGKKSQEEESDRVPLIHVDISNYIFQSMQICISIYF